MQYLFMAALCWMLVEGIYLYLFVVKVYNVNHRMYVYHGVSWGKNIFLLFLLSVIGGNFGRDNIIISIPVHFPDSDSFGRP